MSQDEIDNAVAFAELAGKLDIMMQNIITVKDKQEKMALDITEIKKAVYHPDTGLYARLRELEQWKESYSRLIWMIISAVVGLVVAVIYKTVL
jgi:type II secretory pathway component PulF